MKKVAKHFLDIKKSYNNSKLKTYYVDNLKKPLGFISSIISWSIFLILVITSSLLLYYFVSVKVYSAKGVGYEPRFALYTIISPSMVPNINVYDVVVASKTKSPSEIKEGDIITFLSSDFKNGQVITVTHRVIEVLKQDGNYFYTTKGDNNLIKDPSKVSYDSVVGKVSLKIPQLGRAQFFLANQFGWILVVVIPSLFIIIRELIKLFKLIEIGERAVLRVKKLPLFKKQLLLPLKPNKKRVIRIKRKNSKIDDAYEDLKEMMNKREEK
jgi:signal peptidase